jgi:hypothetical protein
MTPLPFLHFCRYLLFEEDLALYLNKLQFPSPKPVGSGKEDFFLENSVYFYSLLLFLLGEWLFPSFEQT